MRDRKQNEEQQLDPIINWSVRVGLFMVLVCAIVGATIFVIHVKLGEGSSVSGNGVDNYFDTTKVGSDIVEETDFVKQNMYTLDELKNMKALRRNPEIAKNLEATNVGELDMSGISFESSGGKAVSGNEVEVEVESLYAPNVSWADGSIDKNSLIKVVDTIALLYEDKLIESGEYKDCYVEATYATGSDLEKFEAPVIWWIDKDNNLTVSCKLRIYDLTTGEYKEVLKPMTVRFTPEELEIVK